MKPPAEGDRIVIGYATHRIDTLVVGGSGTIGGLFSATIDSGESLDFSEWNWIERMSAWAVVVGGRWRVNDTNDDLEMC